MSSIRISTGVKVDLKDILSGVSELELPELELFLKQLSNLIAHKKAPNLSKEETRLLLKINEGLPKKMQNRYQVLLQKSADETLTEKEHEELLQLIPTVEEKRAERMKYLVELSNIWNLSLEETMRKLGINPPPIIHA